MRIKPAPIFSLNLICEGILVGILKQIVKDPWTMSWLVVILIEIIIVICFKVHDYLESKAYSPIEFPECEFDLDEYNKNIGKAIKEGSYVFAPYIPWWANIKSKGELHGQSNKRVR